MLELGYPAEIPRPQLRHPQPPAQAGATDRQVKFICSGKIHLHSCAPYRIDPHNPPFRSGDPFHQLASHLLPHCQQLIRNDPLNRLRLPFSIFLPEDRFPLYPMTFPELVTSLGANQSSISIRIQSRKWSSGGEYEHEDPNRWGCMCVGEKGW